MILLAVASFLFCRVLGGPIVGGELTTINKHPWLAAIQVNGSLVCAGSILSKSVILTTASCVTEHPLDSLSIRVGSSELDKGGSTHKVVAGKIHEQYTRVDDRTLNNVALVKVQPPMEFCGNVGQIQLASKDRTIVYMDTLVSVTGWGKMPEDPRTHALNATQLRVIHNIDCADRYKYYMFQQFVNWDHLICTETNGTGVCHGDAGSPLVAPDGVQIGLTSWSFSCGESWYPGVYANVAFYRDWIDENRLVLDPPPPEAPPVPTNFFLKWLRQAFWTWSINGAMMN